MENTNDNEEVKEIIERVEVEPSDDTELIDDEGAETESQSSETETEVEEETEEESEDEETDEETEEEPQLSTPEIKDVSGETPRERALRLEITRLRRENSTHKKEELFTRAEPKQQSNVLENYDQDQLRELKTILSAAADELGFVKKDELYNSLNTDKRDEVWENFLEKNPQYLPDNDPEGVFYNQLKEEFSLYKEPTSAKDFQKLLNRVHNSIFGQKSAEININKINAQREKAKVASYTGRTAETKVRSTTKTNTQGLRTDALKGFSDDEINELFAE